MYTDKIHIENQFLSIKDIQQKLETENLPQWKKGVYKFILNWFDNSDFITQKTSGSTGAPKEIHLKKNAMIASARATLLYFNLHDNDTAWLCLPVEYIAGKMMVVRAIVGKLNLILSEPEGTRTPPKLKINFTALVPLQLQRFLESKANFSKVDNIIVGGAAMNQNLIQQCQNIPSKIFATYGMTETCSHIALQQINKNNKQNDFHTLKGISISKTDDGCLKINAPNLIENEIETTDLVEFSSPNSFKWIGRKDNIINSGGIKISPEEIENRVSELYNCENLVIPKTDKLLGEKIVLIVDKTFYQDKHHLLNTLKTEFGKIKAPKELLQIDKFPRTKSMKIDRLKTIQMINKA